MSDKDPLNYSLVQYGLMLCLSLAGGLVAWFAKVRSGVVLRFQLFHLIGELSSSALAGLLMFFACEWAESPKLLTACMVAIAGHMGTRGIELLETFFIHRWHRMTGTPERRRDDYVPPEPPESLQ